MTTNIAPHSLEQVGGDRPSGFCKTVYPHKWAPSPHPKERLKSIQRDWTLGNHLETDLIDLASKRSHSQSVPTIEVVNEELVGVLSNNGATTELDLMRWDGTPEVLSITINLTTACSCRTRRARN